MCAVCPPLRDFAAGDVKINYVKTEDLIGCSAFVFSIGLFLIPDFGVGI
jgi:hypothetical protein